MSGPKKSQWEIRQEIIEQRRREKARKRAKQVNEIKERISLAQNKLNSFSKMYPDVMSQNIINLVNEWIRDINLNGDLRDAFKKIRGIENYLNKQEKILQSKQEKVDAKREMEIIRQEKIKNIIDSLESLKEDYKEILNNGILQRIELFKNAIKANPDNKRTLSQIEKFKQQLFKLQEEYEEKKYKTEYVADKFSKILNGNIKQNENNLEINGNINGVPISVKLNYKNSNIDLNTPLDGSCKKALKTLQESLNKENISLGEIKVLRTGEILNKQYNKNKQRIKI